MTITPPREALLATSIAGMALASLVPQLSPGLTDGGLRLASAFQEVVEDIPRSALVLMITVAADPDGAAAERFVAQHVLAPRLLTHAGNLTTFALTAPGAPATIDGDPRLEMFQLIRVSAAGVRVYRRRF